MDTAVFIFQICCIYFKRTTHVVNAFQGKSLSNEMFLSMFEVKVTLITWLPLNIGEKGVFLKDRNTISIK